MLRRTMTILSLIGLLLSFGLLRISGEGPSGYINASGNILYVLNERICLGRIMWDKMPASERGFYFIGNQWGTTGEIQFSLWVPFDVFAICCLYFLLSFGPYRRRKRKKLGLCVKCGYNLKGLTEQRCPECGTSFAGELLKKNA